MKIEDLISFVSRLIYYIEEKNTSFDKAFIYTRNYFKTKRPLKLYFYISKDIVSKYYFLKIISKEFFGRETRKNIVKTWLILYGEQYPSLRDASLRLKRKIARRGKQVSIDNIMCSLPDEDKIAFKYSVPPWIVKTLRKYMSIGEIELLLKSMLKETLWIRVNTLKISLSEAKKYFEENEVVAEQDSDYCFLFKVLKSKKPIHMLDYVREGKIIIQDKASIVAVDALELSENDVILDLCAAPGLKTSLIFQFLENKCRVVACDISWQRLKNMKKLLKLYGVDLSKVDLIKMDSRKIPFRKLIRVTKVLIDAPCSSSGVMLRDPAIRIQLKDSDSIGSYIIVQKGLVQEAVKHFRGKEIVYATCSLFPQEGEEIIDAVFSEVKLYPLKVPGNPGYRGFKCSNYVKRLFPHVHDTNGFFITKFAA